MDERFFAYVLLGLFVLGFVFFVTSVSTGTDSPVNAVKNVIRGVQRGTQSISCGNEVCEELGVRIETGETKTLSIGEKKQTFKLLRVDEQCEAYFNVDGVDLSQDEARKAFRYQTFNCRNPREGAEIYLGEDRVCAVPDCASLTELKIYKNWNIVPLYFFASSFSSNQAELDQSIKQWSCSFDDFSTVFGYDPINKKYVKIYSSGQSVSEFFDSLANFSTVGGRDKFLGGFVYNSVWVHSKKECMLKKELPKEAEDSLYFLNTLSMRLSRMSQTIVVGGPPPEPEPTPLIFPRFSVGWNFWSGVKDIEGKTFEEIKGSCEVQKAYSFDASTQSWKKIDKAPTQGNGFIFKIKKDCLFNLYKVPLVS